MINDDQVCQGREGVRGMDRNNLTSYWLAKNIRDTVKKCQPLSSYPDVYELCKYASIAAGFLEKETDDIMKIFNSDSIAYELLMGKTTIGCVINELPCFRKEKGY